MMRLTAGTQGRSVREDIIDPDDEEHFRKEHPEMVSEDDMIGEPAVAETTAPKKSKAASAGKKPRKSKKKSG